MDAGFGNSMTQIGQYLSQSQQHHYFDVIAVIGGCSAAESITINAVPYPLVVVGADTVICYQTGAQLACFNKWSSFTWSPQTSLEERKTLTLSLILPEPFHIFLYAFDNKGLSKTRHRYSDCHGVAWLDHSLAAIPSLLLGSRYS